MIKVWIEKKTTYVCEISEDEALWLNLCIDDEDHDGYEDAALKILDDCKADGYARVRDTSINVEPMHYSGVKISWE